ncbi:MAG: tRNA lysidine(34) synthetase TilS [Chloroflexota bacterium]|nr:tRNA lysidine(34) synthetase TilS [Chloroflexota bacterium]
MPDHLHVLERRVLATIQQHQLTQPETTLVVAVSGGVDSLVLMYVLHTLAPLLNVRLHIATLDHRLRGAEGAADAAFVAAEAAKLGLPSTVGEREVEKPIVHMGVEGAARRTRYGFLYEVARAVGAQTIVTAHHADDQSETVLMHILRGTSVHGLAGMRLMSFVPYNPDLRLMRPLLLTRRADIEAYAAEHSLQPRHDATNDDTRLLRNRIRLEVLPYLEQINPRVKRALTQLAETALKQERTAPQFSAWLADAAVRGRIELKGPLLQVAGAARLDDIIVRAHRALAPEHEISHERVEACLHAIAVGAVGTRIELPGGVILRIDYDHAVLERTDHAPRNDAMDAEHASPSGTDKGAGYILLLQPVTLRIPAGAVVEVRHRRDGDRFAPPGLDGHTQKLKQWMIDRKIPQAQRDRVPLIVVNGQVGAIYWDGRWTVGEPFQEDRADAGQSILFTYNS